MKELKMIMKIVLSIFLTISLVMTLVFIGRGYILEAFCSLLAGATVFEISQRV
jgi:hypothetical protein